MNNKFIAIIIAPLALIIAIWATSSLMTMNEVTRVMVIVGILIMSIPAILYRHLTYDFKFLMLLCLGFAVAGKGFAYLSPVEPIYIGEIALSICMLGYLASVVKGVPLLPTRIHLSILLFILLTFVSVIVHFKEYRLLAVRDSSLAYYGLFFFATFTLLRSDQTKKAFIKMGIFMLKAHFFFYCIHLVCLAAGVDSGLRGALLKVNPMLAKFYNMHPDINYVFIVSLAVICLSQFLRKRKPLYLIPIGLAFFTLLEGKSAGAFAFLFTVFMLTVFAKRREFAVLGVVGGLIISLFLGFSYVIGVESITSYVEGMDSVGTVEQTLGNSGQYNTTAWRLTWWRTIWDDTLAINPAFGTGMGSDITTPFLQNYVGYERAIEDAQNYARYPHNIIFTVFGRLGFIGWFVFAIYLVNVVSYLLRFCRYFLRTNNYRAYDLLFFTMFCTGLANAFVQATYEPPYAAIIHWVMLAYIVRRVYDYERSVKVS